MLEGMDWSGEVCISLLVWRVLFWCLSNKGRKLQNNTRVHVYTVHFNGTYIIPFLSWHNELTNDDQITIFTHRLRVSHALTSPLITQCTMRPDVKNYIELVLTHWGRYNIDAIMQTTFSNEFSWMKIYEFSFRFPWSLFELTIFQHCFR